MSQYRNVPGTEMSWGRNVSWAEMSRGLYESGTEMSPYQNVFGTEMSVPKCLMPKYLGPKSETADCDYLYDDGCENNYYDEGGCKKKLLPFTLVFN